jgi:hypothetical protein
VGIDTDVQENYTLETSEINGINQKAQTNLYINNISHASQVMCLNQWIKPQYIFKQEGVGNCKVCAPNEDNKNCSRYYPIRVFQINVQPHNL